MPHKLIENLINGNKRFLAEKLQLNQLNQKRRDELVSGQKPKVIILSCSDSRVTPEFIFDCGHGELFVIRVAGNIANSEAIGSIEYAIAHCDSELIVVLGHESCGAVGAAIADAKDSEHIKNIVKEITPVVHSNKGCDLNMIAKENVKAVIENLKLRSQIISNSSVPIIGAFYSLTGEVTFSVDSSDDSSVVGSKV